MDRRLLRKIFFLSICICASFTLPTAAQTNLILRNTINGVSRAELGQAVEIAGNLAFVGAPGVNNNSGRFYVYRKSGSSNWSRVQEWLVTGEPAGYRYGFSLSSNGQFVAVGAPGANGSRGAVFILEVSGNTLRFIESINAQGGQAGDQFGYSVSMHGNQLLVGAPFHDQQGSNAGAAYLFTRNSAGRYMQSSKIQPSETNSSDEFGTSLALYNNAALIGAPGVLANRGRAYAYPAISSSSSFTRLLPTGPHSGFGKDVALTNTSAAIGAFGSFTVGAVYTYNRSGSNYTFQQILTSDQPSSQDGFGTSLDLYENTLIVGSPKDRRTGSTRGAAFVFSRANTGATWETMQVLDNPASSTTDNYGIAVATRASDFWVGANNARSANGTAYTYFPNRKPIARNDTYTTNKNELLTVPPRGVLNNDTDLDFQTLSAEMIKNVSNGTLTLNSDGSFTYAPNANYTGADTFTYTANDGFASSLEAMVTINVLSINEAPLANDDAYDINEDEELIVDTSNGVLNNDEDVDDDALNVVLSVDVTKGRLTLNGNGSFTYTPNPNFFGEDSFTYVANDGTEDSNEATVTITVNPVNDPPVAVADQAVTNEDLPTLIPVLLNDADIEGSPLTVEIVDQPTGGAAFVSPDGIVGYASNLNFNGTDQFTYKVSDGELESETVTVDITIVPVNDPPVAMADQALTNEDLPTLIPVLLNDGDIDGDPLSVILVDQPTNGAAFVSPDGIVGYASNLNFNGTDQLTYKVSDGELESETVKVDITIAPVNDTPIAVADEVTTDEDTPVQFDILANDSDLDGDDLKATIVNGPANGWAVVSVDGILGYAPNADFNGTDQLTYTVSDGTLTSEEVTVDITVNPVNDAPVATADQAITNEDLPTLIPVLLNDQDADRDMLTVEIVDFPTNGAAFVSPDGIVGYASNLNYNGIDQFTYQVSDGALKSEIVAVDVTIVPVNDAPEAFADEVTTDEDFAVQIDLLANDLDIDSDDLNVIIMEEPTNGSSTILMGGLVEYVPNENFNGEDQLTYKASDGTLESEVVTVSITINPVNDEPVLIGLPENISVNCDAIPETAIVTASDIEDGDLETVVTEEMNAIEGCLHEIIRTWTATDSDGATTTGTQIITAIDDVAPIINGVPTAPLVFEIGKGQCDQLVNYPSISVVDNCSDGLMATFSIPSGSTFPIGETVVMVDAEDACGNETSQSFVVKVIKQLPEITRFTAKALPAPFNQKARIKGSFTSIEKAQLTVNWGDGTEEELKSWRGLFQDVHRYETPGSYNITVSLTDACGSMVTTSETVEIAEAFAEKVTGRGFFISKSKNRRPVYNGFHLTAGFQGENPGGRIKMLLDGGLFFSWDITSLNIVENKATIEGTGVYEGEEVTYEIIAVDRSGYGWKKKDRIGVEITALNGESLVSSGLIDVYGYIKITDDGATTATSNTRALPVEENEELPLSEAPVMNHMEWQVYPNPFAGQLNIDFWPTIDDHVQVKIYTLDGREVARIFDGMTNAGVPYRWNFNPGVDLQEGIYLLSIVGESTNVMERIILERP